MPVRTNYLSIETLTDLLNPPAKLGLPDPTLVRRIVVDEFEDWTGEDSLSVYIVISDDAPDDERIGPLMWPVKNAVRDAITSSGETRFPYIKLGTEADLADQFDDGSETDGE